MRLIPIEHYLAVQTLFYDIQIHRSHTPVVQFQIHVTGRNWLPAGAGQAVLWRVDSLAGALAFIKTYIHHDRHFVFAVVNAAEMVVHAYSINYAFLNREVAA